MITGHLCLFMTPSEPHCPHQQDSDDISLNHIILSTFNNFLWKNDNFREFNI